MQEGVFIKDLFILPEEYITLKKPTRCLKCQKFGHIRATCTKNDVACPKCGGNHEYASCKSEAKCVNCNGNHQSSDTNCPVFIKRVQNLNNLNANA